MRYTAVVSDGWIMITSIFFCMKYHQLNLTKAVRSYPDRGVNHPKGLGDLEVAKEDIEGWAERVMR